MRWPSVEQLQRMFLGMHELVNELQEGAAEDLVRRGRIGSRDGYPSSSGRPSSGGRGGSHADPVADLVTADPYADPVRLCAMRMVEALLEAERQLLTAHEAWRQSLPPTEHPDARRVGLPVCANPHCEALAMKAGRCDACHAYRRKYDRDAGPQVIAERMSRRMRLA